MLKHLFYFKISIKCTFINGRLLKICCSSVRVDLKEMMKTFLSRFSKCVNEKNNGMEQTEELFQQFFGVI
jgi:hypothetical protein